MLCIEQSRGQGFLWQGPCASVEGRLCCIDHPIAEQRDRPAGFIFLFHKEQTALNERRCFFRICFQFTCTAAATKAMEQGWASCLRLSYDSASSPLRTYVLHDCDARVVCQRDKPSACCLDFERQNTPPHRSHLWPRNETDQWDVSPQAANYSARLFTASTKSTPHWIREASFSLAKQQLSHGARGCLVSGFWRPSRSPRPSHLWPRNETDQWDVSPQAANYSALLFTAPTKSTPHWIRSCFLTRKEADKPWSTDAVCQTEQQSVFWCLLFGF